MSFSFLTTTCGAQGKPCILNTVRINKPTTELPAAVPTGTLAPKDFVTIEKNLNTLGFFTPARHRGAKSREKVVSFRREQNGKAIEAQATILPSAKYGLPTTADLDKYLAFHKLLENMRNRVGEISNPVGFTSTQLLTVLGIKDAGNNYQDIYEWLQRMTLTGINSKGIVYMARRKAWVSDTFHVFDRVVTMGSTMPDGAVADKNYVWLSDWQLENINSNYLLPIDLETYRKLRNQIAKILVPLLQVWLYASRAEGRFEKRYPELCEILDIVCHKHLSLIRRQLEPSLTELTHHGYLAAWAIQPTVDGREFKLVATHGEKFFRDQRIRNTGPAATIESPSLPLLKHLTDRGIHSGLATRLLRSLPGDQPIQDQLEYGDYLIWKSRSTIKNAPGFYVYLLKQNILPPQDFETSTRIQLRKASAESQHIEVQRRMETEDRYNAYCRAQVQRYLATLDDPVKQNILAEKLSSVRRQWGHLPKATIEELAHRQLETELQIKLKLPTLEVFEARHPQPSLFETD